MKSGMSIAERRMRLIARLQEELRLIQRKHPFLLVNPLEERLFSIESKEKMDKYLKLSKILEGRQCEKNEEQEKIEVLQS